MSTPYLRPFAGGVEIQIVVRPRASRTRTAGILGDRLRMQVAAPPVDGEANEAIVDFLAGKLCVRRADVTIAAGLRGKRKTVRVAGIDAASAAARLEATA